MQYREGLRAPIRSELHKPTIAPELPKKINAEKGFSAANAPNRRKARLHPNLNSQTACPPRTAVRLTRSAVAKYISSLDTRIKHRSWLRPSQLCLAKNALPPLRNKRQKSPVRSFLKNLVLGLALLASTLKQRLRPLRRPGPQRNLWRSAGLRGAGSLHRRNQRRPPRLGQRLLRRLDGHRHLHQPHPTRSHLRRIRSPARIGNPQHPLRRLAGPLCRHHGVLLPGRPVLRPHRGPVPLRRPAGS